MGGATGALAGFAAVWLQPLGFTAGGGFVLGITRMGALVGTWASRMIDASVPNTRLKAFDKDLEAGRVGLMVDVSEERKGEIRELVTKHPPEACDQGADPGFRPSPDPRLKTPPRPLPGSPPGSGSL